jgi:3-oxoacyl-[acyl-carrier-protein] synthase-3
MNIGWGEHGVKMRGIGSWAPEGVLTNDDLVSMMDTSDEWIQKRTGVLERRVLDPDREDERHMATEAMRRALDDAGLEGRDLDLLIHASVTSEMTCPSNACRIAAHLEMTPAGAFDLVAACSGFVYGLNLADTMIRSGRYKRIGVIGSDALTTHNDFTERSVSILFGDGAGAVVLERDEDPSRGCMYQTMGADGEDWGMLYMPNHPHEVPEWDRATPIRLGCLRMHGREVYKFAVTQFQEVISDALSKTGLAVDDISQFVCHQSNVRIIESAKEKLGLPDEKVRVNIDKYGNTSAGSCGLVLDELYREGLVKDGDYVVFVAFGGGLTWASCVWKM